VQHGVRLGGKDADGNGGAVLAQRRARGMPHSPGPERQKGRGRAGGQLPTPPGMPGRGRGRRGDGCPAGAVGAVVRFLAELGMGLGDIDAVRGERRLHGFFVRTRLTAPAQRPPSCAPAFSVSEAMQVLCQCTADAGRSSGWDDRSCGLQRAEPAD
jgi:hypothetical protein